MSSSTLCPVQWLRKEFMSRKHNNPCYSMNAFARQIGLPSGRLSELLSRKRPLTPRLGKTIAANLGLSRADTKRFMNAIHRERNPVVRKVRHYHALSEDKFDLVADWRHFSLMALMQTSGFKSDIKWIARRLNLNSTEVSDAIERLERLKLVVKDRGRFVVKHQNTSTTNEVPSAAVKRSHKDWLKQAEQSLDKHAVAERGFYSQTFVMNPERVAEAKDLIHDFTRRLAALMEFTETEEEKLLQSEVFHMGVQFFPVTSTKEPKNVG